MSNSDINRRLFTPINVLRNWSPDYANCSQQAYISTVPLRGFTRSRQQFYVSPRFNGKYDETTLMSLTVPGETQTNTITIDLAAGGHVVRWVHTNEDVASRDIVNLFQSQGRGWQSTLVWEEKYDACNISTISAASQARVDLVQNHPFEPGKRVKVVITGVTSSQPVADAAIVTALNATHKCHTSITGTSYRQSFVLDVDSSAATGTLSGGTASFHIIHNPTQGGSGVGQSPSVNTNESDAYQTSDAVFNQGSILLTKPRMELIGSNQGYIETVVCPLDFNSSGEASGVNGNEHGGSKYTPVLWHGIKLTTKIWINYEGQEGVHRFETTAVRDNDLLVGSNLPGYEWVSLNQDVHWTYNLGLGSGIPRAKAISIGAGGTPEVFGDDYLDAIDWPGAAAGEYWEPEDGGHQLILLPGYCVRTTTAGGTETEDDADNPWFDQGDGAGGGLIMVSSDEFVAAGMWSVLLGSNTTLASCGMTPFPAAGYGVDSYGCLSGGVAHHINANSGSNTVLKGSDTVTSWFVTGTPGRLFGTSFFQNIYDREYF